MNRKTYTDKYFSILNLSKLNQLNHDPTGKLQRVIRKLKPKLPSNIYSKIYLSGSYSGKFYETSKIHKMSPNDSVQLYLSDL